MDNNLPFINHMKEITEKRIQKRLNWIVNHYTYYSDYLFQNANEFIEGNLHVYYRFMVLESHPWTFDSNFQYASTSLNKNRFGFNRDLFQRVIKSDDYFIISGWHCLFYVIVISILRIRRIPFSIYTDTPPERKRNFKQNIKVKWLDWVFKNREVTLLATGKIGVQRARSIFSLDKEQVRNLPFATNTDFFKPFPTKQNQQTTEIRFLSVGRIEFWHKGQDLAVEALSRLKKKGHSNFKYMIAGIGQDVDNLKKLAADVGILENLVLLGWVEISALPELFNSVHFTIHSSREDPFPNSVLESLSCGIPVIASNAAGSAMDRIKHGSNGFIHQSDDVNDLTDMLNNAMLMPKKEYEDMRKSSRESALEWHVNYHGSLIQELVQRTTLVENESKLVK